MRAESETVKGTAKHFNANIYMIHTWYGYDYRVPQRQKKESYRI